MASAPAVVQATPKVMGVRVLNDVSTTPAVAQSKNLVSTIKNLGRGMDRASILKEFEWKQKGNSDIKDLVITQTSHMVFVFMKVGSFFIQLVHSVGKFAGDPFDPAKYRGRVIGFVGDRIQ